MHFLENSKRTANRMNESVLADFEICRDCGRCCRSFFFWHSNTDGFSDRLNLLPDISASKMNGSHFIEIKATCREYDEGSGKCEIFGAARRPKLCSEFPDNLFNRATNGDLILDDKHGESMRRIYGEICPAVDRIGTSRIT